MTRKVNQAELHSLLRQSPSLFFAQLFPKIDNTEGFECPWHLHAISQHLLEMYNGQCRRLIINAPPRSLKTSMANSYFIPWLLGKNPKTKIIVVTYGDDLSTTLAHATKKVFIHPAYQQIFPHTVLENDRMQATRLRTPQGGQVIFTSIHGALTGLGADWIILDDPLQAAHMRSEVRQDDLAQVFRHSVTTRLNNPETGKMLLIQQRISPNDLCGDLTRDPGHPWTVLSLPARFDQPAEFNLGIFGPKGVTAGELLTPHRMSERFLSEKQSEMGHAAFYAQYLQKPLVEEDCPIDFGKIKYISRDKFSQIDLVPTIFQSWDTALSDKPTADYSALTTWARLEDGRFILIDATRYRVSSDKLQSLIIQNAIAHSARFVCIEAANHAVDLIRMVSEQMPDGCTVRSVALHGLSKMQRLEAQLHKINTGKVVFLGDEPNLDLVTNELRQFPNGRHDDLVDSFSQALSEMGKGSGIPAWRIS
ncbi:phage terminase large subunit [Planktomarina sp.]|nr:phage terminase large subunit [Planktomarina sp.]MDA9100036.1 phage terminase large subunit [Planktomarina sp.]